jgi:hypothetical protein
MRGPLIVLPCLILAACASPGPGRGTSGSSGITGRVVLFPTSPVETGGSPGPTKGVRTTVAIESSDGERTELVRTGPDGSFRIELEPGDYLLSAMAPPSDPHLVPRPASAKVEPGTFVGVTVILDTRLREP